ncbi:MAG: lipid II:glycine glycyltransferase FemX [Bryobacteraceae bacterium]
MTDAHGIAGDWLPDADRLTPFGKVLRSTSLDESPNREADYRLAHEPRCAVLRPEERGEWMKALEQCAQHDFYHLPEYHRMEADHGGGTARLFVYREGEHVVALPLLLRPVTDAAPEGWKDATSVYGYGGPLASSPTMPATVLDHFHNALRQSLAEQRVVSVFSRLHPLLAPAGLLDGLGECRSHGQTVSIDLTLPAEQQRAAYRSSYRRRINKLQRAGVVCVCDEDQRHLAEFASIYHETMRRVNAHHSYLFDPDYFTALADGLGSKLQLFVVMAEGRVAAGGLFTICGGIAQYHLGGTRDAFLSLSPTGLIFDTVRQWAAEHGARVLHLGGGVGSKDDSLFHFKAGFSDCRHAFHTWRWVIDPGAYRELCDERLHFNRLYGLEPESADFFPAYRCPAT